MRKRLILWCACVRGDFNMANQAVDHAKVNGKEAVDGPLRPETGERLDVEEEGRAKPLAQDGEGRAASSPH